MSEQNDDDWQKRLVDEERELSEKIQRLSDRLEEPNGLDNAQADVMRRQLESMEEYKDCLTKRLEMLELVEKEPRLLWLDVETTGLDPEKDKVLELSAVVTDMSGNKIFDLCCAVVLDKTLNMEDMREWARETHTKNRLLDLVRESPVAKPAASVRKSLMDLVWEQSRGRVLYPAGRNVSFDIKFIEKLCGASLQEWGASHRHVDMSSLETVLNAVGMGELTKDLNPSPRTHRAHDCLAHDIAIYSIIFRSLRAMKEEQ